MIVRLLHPRFDGTVFELQERWMVEPDFIPSTPLDLVVLREKFVEAVRRHLLAEVTLEIISNLVYFWVWKWEERGVLG